MHERIKDERHPVIWITGAAGVGKTTLAKELRDRKNFLILEDDELGALEGTTSWYSFYAQLAVKLAKQTPVIITSIPPDEAELEIVKRMIRDNPLTTIFLERVANESSPVKSKMILIDTNRFSVEETTDMVLAHVS